MGADHTTTHMFDERVARDYEAWYEQGFGRFASQQEEALLYQQLQHFPGASSLRCQSDVEPVILPAGL